MGRLTADDYRAQLAALTPPGAALPSETDSEWQLLLAGLAEEFSHLDNRGWDLLRESDIESTSELLTDWERVLNLPGPCDTLAATVQERRKSAHSKLISLGGQSPAYFKEIANALGYEVVISEYRPFRAGRSSAGDSLTNQPWLHRWIVRGPSTTVTPFRAGQSRCGEPLRSWGEDRLECPIRALKPAHTEVSFSYEEYFDNA